MIHVNQVHTRPQNVGENVGLVANLDILPTFVGKIQQMEEPKELEELPKLYKFPILKIKLFHQLEPHLKRKQLKKRDRKKRTRDWLSKEKKRKQRRRKKLKKPSQQQMLGDEHLHRHL